MLSLMLEVTPPGYANLNPTPNPNPNPSPNPTLILIPKEPTAYESSHTLCPMPSYCRVFARMPRPHDPPHPAPSCNVKDDQDG